MASSNLLLSHRSLFRGSIQLLPLFLLIFHWFFFSPGE
uniref:Uncharacterized protein n=1 Tax=Nelumbo nucifera TaxID=4432 RepID=A0A822XX97_NELNU|nr:TPA_asm: hypothetical protein HUJ06_027712 [Nelumbo nucifera]